MNFIKLILPPLKKVLKRALVEKAPDLPSFNFINTEKNTVRSVQRIYNPKKQNAQWVAKYYPVLA